MSYLDIQSILSRKTLSIRELPQFILDAFSSLGLHLLYLAFFMGFCIYEESIRSLVLLGTSIVLYVFLMHIHKNVRRAFLEFAEKIRSSLETGKQPFVPFTPSRHDPPFVGLVRNGQFRQALPLLLEAIDTEDATAMFLLGCMYYQGQVVPRSASQAFLLLEKSASAGYAPALLFLGVAYRDGAIVQPDLVKAKTFLTEAARKNNPTALFELNKLLESTGENMPRGLVH